jgi:hypothetical protein
MQVLSSSSPPSGSFFNRWLAIGTGGVALAGIGSAALFEPSFFDLVPGLQLPSIAVRIVGGVLVAVGVGAITIVRSRRALFVVSLSVTLCRTHLKGHNHWDEIVPGKLILGALPLQRHVQALKKDEQITGIVALVEHHELQATCGYEPVSMSAWASEGVSTNWVQTADYEAVSPASLIAAADWMHAHLMDSPNNKIYCMSHWRKRCLHTVSHHWLTQLSNVSCCCCCCRRCY